MADNSAAGSQPGPLPVVDHTWRADARHYTKGRPRVRIAGVTVISDKLEYIVLHSTVGRDSRRYLTIDPSTQVSAHILIARDGRRYNLVDYNDTAHHVGQAKAGYRNSNCIGAELENINGHPSGVREPYTTGQINTLAHWTATILFSYGLPLDSIRHHGEIALPKGRRTDPIGFADDGPRYIALTSAWLTFFKALPEASHGLYIV